jgi:hypothetical protein
MLETEFIYAPSLLDVLSSQSGRTQRAFAAPMELRAIKCQEVRRMLREFRVRTGMCLSVQTKADGARELLYKLGLNSRLNRLSLANET